MNRLKTCVNNLRFCSYQMFKSNMVLTFIFDGQLMMLDHLLFLNKLIFNLNLFQNFFILSNILKNKKNIIIEFSNKLKKFNYYLLLKISFVFKRVKGLIPKKRR